jgi:3-hexulose-6-phosphate synthase/6-phospho-3-hexuloisomerase
MQTIVQISLDLTSIPEAIDTARMALRAGVDYLEVGTPLIIAEGMTGIRALRAEFGPDVPIVADLKTMDGGWLEAELMAKAGATHVVVMARAHEETIKVVVKAGRDFGIYVMGDNLGCEEMVATSGRRAPTPLDQLSEVVCAVNVPVQAVGGLSIEQAMQTPEYGAPLVVLGAPLTIDAESFQTAGGDLESKLRLICDAVHAYGDVGPRLRVPRPPG